MNHLVRFVFVIIWFIATSCVAQGITSLQDIVNLELREHMRTSHSDVSKQHAHPESVEGAAAAQADRFAGMLSVIMCDARQAEQYFAYAREHDGNNQEVISAEKYMQEVLRAKSDNLVQRAEASELEALEYEQSSGSKAYSNLFFLLTLNDAKWLYHDALQCDRSNSVAQAGYERVWQKQHGGWTFLERLGLK